ILSGVVSLLIVTMVSRETRAEREAREANAQMERFLGATSHELRAPITVGKGVIQLAKRRVMRLRASEDAPAPDTQDGDDEPTSRLEKLLTSAEEQMDRLTRLVNDLLDFSRIRAGKLNLRLGACDLSALMCELAEEQRAMHPGRRIEVAFPAHGGPHVLADCA